MLSAGLIAATLQKTAGTCTLHAALLVSPFVLACSVVCLVIAFATLEKRNRDQHRMSLASTTIFVTGGLGFIGA
jgi:uncharacterized membrane protein YozB (DUF420 family)